MNRRTFIAASAASTMLAATPDNIPIIDCHIHFFDTARPGGVPWPDKSDTVRFKPALPARYRSIAHPLGIVGAIEVEASPLLEDNQWVLDISEKDKMIVGTVGDLLPEKPEFRHDLDRFAKNPLFRGIRYGNIWDRNLTTAIQKPEFIDGMKELAKRDLVLDSANPTPQLLTDILHLTDKVPNLRIVLDHLPQLFPLPDATLRELAKRPHVFVKVSSVLRRVDGRVPQDLAFYRPQLDQIWGVFGEDRLVYGSDWPNSDGWAEYPVVLKLVQEYFREKGQKAAEKYFWRNSLTAYKWVHRDKSQPKA